MAFISFHRVYCCGSINLFWPIYLSPCHVVTTMYKISSFFSADMMFHRFLRPKSQVEHLSASGEYLKNITKTTHTHTQRCVRRNMCDVLSSTNVNLIYGIEHAHRVERYRNIQAVYSLQESESRRNIVYFVYTYIYLLKYSCDSLSIHLSLWSPQTFRYR